MKIFKSISIALLAAVALAGCGERVEVGPAQIGKIMTSKGYQAGFIPTSKFRLDACLPGEACDKLVVMDVADRSKQEKLEVFMPEDKLLMNVIVETTLTVDPKKSEPLFNTLPQSAIEDRDQMSMIAWDTIYTTYARQIILAETGEFISKFNIPYIASNRDIVNTKLRDHLKKQIEARTPFITKYVGLVDVKYPPMIVNAQLKAAERREEIQKQEAELEVSKVKLERELQEARLNRQIEIEKAETEAASQKAQAATITPLVLEKIRLDNERARIDKWDGKLPETLTSTGSDVSVVKKLP